MNTIELAKRIKRENDANLDANLSDAISRRLGRDDWTLDDVRGRMIAVDRVGLNAVVYVFDGVPLLQVSPKPDSDEALLTQAPIYTHL